MPGTRFCLHAKASNSKLRTAAARPWKVSWMAGNWPTPDGDRFSLSGNLSPLLVSLQTFARGGFGAQPLLSITLVHSLLLLTVSAKRT